MHAIGRSGGTVRNNTPSTRVLMVMAGCGSGVASNMHITDFASGARHRRVLLGLGMCVQSRAIFNRSLELHGSIVRWQRHVT